MTRLYILVAIVAVASGVLVTGACMTRAEDPQPFLIVWNYDTSGYLEVCGCSAHQLGGLGRRATKIDALREKQPVLLIEGAHFVGDAGEFQLYKGETVVRALNILGYNGVMFGLREAQHGPEGLARLESLSTAPCFSANLVVDGQAWPVASITADIAGTTVGVTGASQPEAVNFELPEGISFDDPAASLDRALAGLAGRTDINVLCLEGEDTWIDTMVRRFSGQADLVLTGNRSPVTATLEFTASPPRLNNWQLGKYLGIVAVDPAEDSAVFAGMNVPLEDSLAESPAITAMLDRDYRSHLKEKFFSRMKTDLEQLYLPPDSCEPCHAEAYASYTNSGHAQALNTLLEANQVYNPDCMSCHLVYDPGQDELQPINCIICHGNITEQHLWDAVEGNVTPPEAPVTSYTYESCAGCHNELNSLPFAEHWPQYVNRIFHGGDDSAARGAAEDMGLDYTAPPPDIMSH